MAQKQKEDEELRAIYAWQVHPQFDIPIRSNIFPHNSKHHLLWTKDERDNKCVRWLDERSGKCCIFDEEFGWLRNVKGPGYMILNSQFILTEKEKEEVTKLCRQHLDEVCEKLNDTTAQLSGMIEEASGYESTSSLAEYYRQLAFARQTLYKLDTVRIPRL